MGTTNFNFTLGPQLLKNLTGTTSGTTSGNNNGAYVFALAFQGGTLVSSTTLVSQGNYIPANTTMPVTTPLASGNIIIVTQQVCAGNTSTLLNGLTSIGQVLDPTAAKT